MARKLPNLRRVAMFKGLNIKTAFLFLLSAEIFFPYTAFALNNTVTNTEQKSSFWQSLKTKPWFHPILTLETGISIEQLGKSQSYAPLDLCSYNYDAHQSSKERILGGLFVGTEIPIARMLAVDVGAEYNQSAAFTSNGTLTQGADVVSSDSYSYKYRVASKQLLFDGKLLWNIRETVHLYALAGVGAAFNNAYSYQTSVPPYYEYTPYYSNNSVTNFSYSVGAGVNVNVAKEWRLGVGYRFTDLGKANLGNGNLDGIPIANTLKQSNLYANQVLAELSYVPSLN